uniref:Acyl-coenzyme A thioesterase 8 n=1 Tax=Steinernema glaseri TaxID=37863 RepID=A0A1I7YTW2_9BILA
MATEKATMEIDDKKKEVQSNGNGSACVCSSSRAEDVRAGLVDTFLNLERIEANHFLGRHLLKGRKSLSTVYGGQVIGQALSAATRTVDPSLVPHSLHSYFLETGDVNRPILYMVDKVRDGRSFSTRIVKAIQGGRTVFTTQISFHKVEPDAIVHQHTMPQVTPPEDLEDIRPLIEKALKEKDLPPLAKTLLKYKLADLPAPFDRVFQFRPVNQDDFLMTNKNPEPRSCFWLKANEDIGDDPELNYTIAAFISDSTMIETALRPHCSEGFVPSMVFSLDHCIWLHKPNFRVDEWMLYENYSSVAGGSRAFIEGRLWTRDGQLVMSTAQEGLIRAQAKK